MQKAISFETTTSSDRTAKAINAVKKMQEISVSLGNDKLTLEEINAVIDDARGKNKKMNAVMENA